MVVVAEDVAITVVEPEGDVVTDTEAEGDTKLNIVTAGLSDADTVGLLEAVATLEAGISAAVAVAEGTAVLEAVGLGGSAPTVGVVSAERVAVGVVMSGAT